MAMLFGSSAALFVVDQHYSSNVSCTARYFNAGGSWGASSTVSSSGSSSSYQSLVPTEPAYGYSFTSRFFYCSKPSRAERDSGCQNLPARKTPVYSTSVARSRRNTHPTVKPVALMTWLVQLACPPGGTVLDPFTGSGTTGIATLQTERRFIGVERDPGYARIALARLRHAAAPQKVPRPGRG